MPQTAMGLVTISFRLACFLELAPEKIGPGKLGHGDGHSDGTVTVSVS